METRTARVLKAMDVVIMANSASGREIRRRRGGPRRNKGLEILPISKLNVNRRLERRWIA